MNCCRIYVCICEDVSLCFRQERIGRISGKRENSGKKKGGDMPAAFTFHLLKMCKYIKMFRNIIIKFKYKTH